MPPKGRPSFNPLIAHVADRATAHRLAVFSAEAELLADAFWPGPLTLVLPKRADCPVAELATAGLDSIALRMPGHVVARSILAAFGGPVVAPSANRSGHVSPTTAAHVQMRAVALHFFSTKNVLLRDHLRGGTQRNAASSAA